MTDRPLTLPAHTIVVWFSHGAPSACALKLTVEKYGAANVRALNNPVAEEDPDNLRFGRDVAAWCGVEIEEVKSSKFPTASADTTQIYLRGWTEQVNNVLRLRTETKQA